jgi:SET domain-containing protein
MHANCRAVELDGRVFVYAVRDIVPGEEVFISYDLSLDNDADEEARIDYVCQCGSRQCCGTMLAP